MSVLGKSSENGSDPMPFRHESYIKKALPSIDDFKKTGEQTLAKKWGAATLFSYDAVMKDTTKKGSTRYTKYKVTSGWNLDDRIALDVPVARGNPMMTRNSGSTKARMLNSIAAGFPTDHISVSDQALSLATMGLHETAIVQHLSDAHGRRKDAMLLSGESRHAMISIAMAWLASEQNIHVLDLAADAPCFARLDKDIGRTYRRTVRFAGREALTAASLFARDPAHMLQNAWMLIPPHADRLNYQADTRALLSGRVGYAAENLPKDISGRIALFTHDWWSRPTEWLDILDSDGNGKSKKYPNLDIVLRPGSHATLGSYDEVHEQGLRMQQLAERYRANEL